MHLRRRNQHLSVSREICHHTIDRFASDDVSLVETEGHDFALARDASTAADIAHRIVACCARRIPPHDLQHGVGQRLGLLDVEVERGQPDPPRQASAALPARARRQRTCGNARIPRAKLPHRAPSRCSGSRRPQPWQAVPTPHCALGGRLIAMNLNCSWKSPHGDCPRIRAATRLARVRAQPMILKI